MKLLRNEEDKLVETVVFVILIVIVVVATPL
jgi:hypothetical protein